MPETYLDSRKRGHYSKSFEKPSRGILKKICPHRILCFDVYQTPTGRMFEPCTKRVETMPPHVLDGESAVEAVVYDVHSGKCAQQA